MHLVDGEEDECLEDEAELPDLLQDQDETSRRLTSRTRMMSLKMK